MKRTTCLVLASALFFSVTAACTDSDDGDTDDVEQPGQPEQPEQPEQPTAPKPQSAEDYDDLAQGIATVVVTGSGGGDIASVSDSVSIALGVRPFGFSADAQGRVHGNRFGVDYSYELVCVDGAGNSLDQCNELTDRATVDVAWSGELDTSNFDAGVERTGTWTIENIQSGTASFGGVSDFELNSTFTGLFRPVTRTYHLDYNARYSDILVDVDTKKILSGTAEYTVNAERMVSGDGTQVDASFGARAVVTFERDRVIVVLDGEYTYHVDARTGAVTRA